MTASIIDFTSQKVQYIIVFATPQTFLTKSIIAPQFPVSAHPTIVPPKYTITISSMTCEMLTPLNTLNIPTMVPHACPII